MPTPPSPRIRGPKAVKVDPRILLEAALVVFSRDGLPSASMRAIAREAGCDPALIYYHFASKEAMFRALLEDRIPPLVASLRQLADPGEPRSTPEKLWAIQGIFHAHFQSSGGFRAMVRGEMVRGAGGIKAILTEQLAEAQKAIRTVIQQGMDQGDLRSDLNPFLVAFFLVRMEFEILDLVPALSLALAGMAPETAVPLAERTWFQVFWRGIAARPDDPLPLLSPAPSLL